MIQITINNIGYTLLAFTNTHAIHEHGKIPWNNVEWVTIPDNANIPQSLRDIVGNGQWICGGTYHEEYFLNKNYRN